MQPISALRGAAGTERKAPILATCSRASHLKPPLLTEKQMSIVCPAVRHEQEQLVGAEP